MTGNDGVSIGELSRQMQDVLIRFEGLTRRLEEQFARRETLELYRANIDLSLKQTSDKVNEVERVSVDQAEFQALANRVRELEEDKKWMTRLVIGFVVLTVLGAFIAVSGSVPTR